MPRYRMEVQACTECSGALVSGRTTTLGYLPSSIGDTTPILACEHIRAIDIGCATCGLPRRTWVHNTTLADVLTHEFQPGGLAVQMTVTAPPPQEA